MRVCSCNGEGLTEADSGASWRHWPGEGWRPDGDSGVEGVMDPDTVKTQDSTPLMQVFCFSVSFTDLKLNWLL